MTDLCLGERPALARRFGKLPRFGRPPGRGIGLYASEGTAFWVCVLYELGTPLSPRKAAACDSVF